MDNQLASYLPASWADENPWFLFIQLRSGNAFLVIDLGRKGWAAEYAEYLREPAYWRLVEKTTLDSPFSMVVHPGEQPYYTCRVIGNTSSPEPIRIYGIGKKRVDGHTDRLWVLPNGDIVTGDDESHFGPLLLKELNNGLNPMR